MLACKSFKQSSTNLCEAIATMAKNLCTQYIDSSTIEPLVASRLIPLDIGEGAVRPIGVGEVTRRICGKCVMTITKRDVVEASGSLQLCAGQKSGSEAAIHAMHRIFEADDTDAVLLIDASNAFNALNRAVALHNIRVLCTYHCSLRHKHLSSFHSVIYHQWQRDNISRGNNSRRPTRYGTICSQHPAINN